MIVRTTGSDAKYQLLQAPSAAELWHTLLAGTPYGNQHVACGIVMAHVKAAAAQLAERLTSACMIMSPGM